MAKNLYMPNGAAGLEDGTSFIPFDTQDFELPDDLWDHMIDEIVFNGEDGWLTDYPDEDGNGYADIWDAYLAGGGGGGIILNPSWGHAGG